MEGTSQPRSDLVVANGRPGGGGSAGPKLDGPLLTVDELANLLAVKPGWVYAAAREGQLPYVRVGKHLRFIRDDIEHWILKHRTTSEQRR